jgi:hypothetical protein
MGWPLAVANGLGERRDTAVFATLIPLAAGHLLAMAVVLVPFALLSWLLQASREIRVGAGLLVLLFGVSRLFLRRHPRWMARIGPTQLALWSFVMATAHGAALMLVPFFIGLCETPPAVPPSNPFGHDAAMALMLESVGTAVAVSLVHTGAMLASGLAIAWIVYRYLGLRALRSTWIDLDGVWAISLMVSGGAAVLAAW